jgi:hypothetical protein
MILVNKYDKRNIFMTTAITLIFKVKFNTVSADKIVKQHLSGITLISKLVLQL